MKYSVKLSALAEEHMLTPVYLPDDYESKEIITPEVSRPGLQLSGFYQYFDETRIQIMGRVETAYLDCLHPIDRRRCFQSLMMRHIPALVVCHRRVPHEETLEMARQYEVPVFTTDTPTSEFMSHLIDSLNYHLAPREIRHGVLVEVHGEGILILGESGIGKSETALELIKRGHRLIADDAVEIKRTSHKTLLGSPLEMTRYFMELRGIGIINVRYIYGVGAVKPSENIDLVVTLESWETETPIDRLGIDTEEIEILDTRVPHVRIPVRPGRNLAVILELAAMNNRQKKMGYNSAIELVDRHDRFVDGIDVD